MLWLFAVFVYRCILEDSNRMSIKLLALDLYRAQQKVHRLEAQLAEAPFSAREALEAQLREAGEELRMLRNMLEGAKSPSPYRSHPAGPKRQGR
jgi:hypothetical protein